MAKAPDKPKKDPARPTRSKAHRPDSAPIDPALADILNPAINAGNAGIGSGTGLQPPPDNSFDRRSDFAAAHTARKSTTKGLSEAPQAGYVARVRASPGELVRIWRALGITEEDEVTALPDLLDKLAKSRRCRDRSRTG